MNHKKYISIPQPCSEDWDKMNPVAQGRFCLSCEKKVIDFTSMPDYELIAYLKNHKNSCGRFTNSQLNRSYDFNPATRKPFIFKAIIFSAINLFGVKSNAQNIEQDTTEIVTQNVLAEVSCYNDSTCQEEIVAVDTLKSDTLETVNLQIEVIEIQNPIIYISSGSVVFGMTNETPEVTLIEKYLTYFLDFPFRSHSNDNYDQPTELIIPPKEKNKKSSPPKLFFVWMSTLPVYRLLKEKLRLRKF